MSRWRLLLILLTVCSACSNPEPLTGERRWRKFVTMEPDRQHPWLPVITTDKGTYSPKDRIVLEVSAPVETYLYVFMMIPNGDIYLLAPSPRVKDHRGKRLVIAPEGAEYELFAPELTGTYYFGVVASEQNISLLSDGWLSVDDKRDFDTWPRDLALDPALGFITEALEDKPWCLASTSIAIARTYRSP